MIDETALGEKVRLLEIMREKAESLLQAIEAAKAEIESFLQTLEVLEDEKVSIGTDKENLIEAVRTAVEMLYKPLDAAEEKEKGYIKDIIHTNKKSYEETNLPFYVWDALSWVPCLRSREELRWCDEYLSRV